MALNPTIVQVIDHAPELLRRVQALTKHEVLVGVPAAKNPRKQGAGGVNNAMLAYVHEHGSPARNLPARPFLGPAIRAVRAQVRPLFWQAAHDALLGHDPRPTLHRIGLIARNEAVRFISDWPHGVAPLKPATIRARLRRTQAGRRQLKRLTDQARSGHLPVNQVLADWATARMSGGGTFIVPLIDTGALRSSISYVVR
jgi:hypothetical protein